MRSSVTTAPWPLVILLALAVPRAQAQSRIDSPYSAYGLGNLVGNTQVPQLLMGGVSVAYTDPAGISPINPASYTGLRKTAFEIGLVGQRSTLSSTDGSQSRNTGQLLGFTLGLPWKSGRWALALGMLPVSSVGYLIGDQDTLTTGRIVKQTYEGSGGLSRGFLGLAHTVWQSKPDSTGRVRGRLSLGGNLNGQFGTIEQTRKAVYPVGQNYLNYRSYSGVVLRGFSANFGLHYSNELISVAGIDRKRKARYLREKDAHQAWVDAHPGQTKAAPVLRLSAAPVRFLVGLSAEVPASLGATRNALETSYTVSGGIDLVRDTTLFEVGRKGTFFIPPAYGLGLSILTERWTISGDVRRRDWSGLRLDVEGYSLNADLQPSMTYSMGASFRPARDREREFFKRIVYRAGVRYADEYLQVNGISLNETSVSGGFSIPLSEGNYLSRVNLGMMLGRRGTGNDGALQERYTNFYLGFTLTPNLRERWFTPYRIE